MFNTDSFIRAEVAYRQERIRDEVRQARRWTRRHDATEG